MHEFGFTRNRRASKNEGSPGYVTKGNIQYQWFILIGMRARSIESSCILFQINFNCNKGVTKWQRKCRQVCLPYFISEH